MSTTTPADHAEEVAYYDRFWSRPGRMTIEALDCQSYILTQLARLPLAHPKILDFGCGKGLLSAKLARIGEVTGIDLSPQGIEHARSVCSKGRFIVGSVFDYPPSTSDGAGNTLGRPSEFELVVSQEVIEHVQQQQRYVDLMWEYLRTGGYLILTTPNRPALLSGGLTMEEMRAQGILQPIENWLDAGELRRLLEGRFEMLHMSTFYHLKGWRYWIPRIVLHSRALTLLASIPMLGSAIRKLRYSMLCGNLVGDGGGHLGIVARKKEQ